MQPAEVAELSSLVDNLVVSLGEEGKLEQSYRDYLGTLKVNLQVAVSRLDKIMDNPKLVESLRHELPISVITHTESMVIALNEKLSWAGRT